MLMVLMDHPRLKGGPGNGRGDTRQYPPEHQNLVMSRVFRQARHEVEDSTDHTHELAAVLVRESAHEQPRDDAGCVACDEELTDLIDVEAVVSVQRVDVRALHPVRQHHDEEDLPRKSMTSIKRQYR